MTPRLALVLGAALAFLAVALGAFGAHALKARLSPDDAAIWHTAVQYHGWHALALLACGLMMQARPEAGAVAVAAWLFVAGVLLFAGSLYALALGAPRAIGAVTPIGGIAFLAGWAALGWGVWRS